MLCKECQKRDQKIHFLQRQISLLKDKNLNLSQKLEELINHQTLLSGIKGEKLILNIAKGTTTKRGAPYDIRLHNGGKVEVKYSRVTTPVHGSSCRRWGWNGITGERDLKDYDVLVLVGEKDGEYHKFEDDGSNFVFFILKKEAIRKIITPGGRRGWASLNINPVTTRSPFSKFLWHYRVGSNDAKKFFDRLVVKR